MPIAVSVLPGTKAVPARTTSTNALPTRVKTVAPAPMASTPMYVIDNQDTKAITASTTSMRERNITKLHLKDV